MPIVDVHIVGPMNTTLRSGLARRLADAIGTALDSSPQGTWVRLDFIPADHYAENGDGPPPDVWPVFVTILMADPPRAAERRAQARRLATIVADACGRDVETVHLIYDAPARGRIAFGGEMDE